MIPCLQRAVDRYDKHRRPELVEAFLILATQDNTLFRKILAEPRHPTYLDLMEILRSSTRIGTIRLILNFLSDRFAPSAALQIVAHRADLFFVRQLLRRIGDPIAPQMKSNLRRLDALAWLQEDVRLIDALDEDEQRATVALVMASGINRLQVFEVLKHILRHGKTLSRRAASAALVEFGGVDASELTVAGLEDPDPEVQANMVLQLRERGVTGAISRLIALLDHSAEVVREAARKSLNEFSFARYLSVFDMMDEGTRRSTGTLVMRIDTEAANQLADELRSAVRTRRLRALEVAIMMDAVHEVEALIIGLLKDEDHFVRAEAAGALSRCNTPLAKEALRQALMDRSLSVREAAEAALRRLIRSESTHRTQHADICDTPP